MESQKSTNQTNIININDNNIDDSTQSSSYEPIESLSRSSLSESFTNTLENLSVGTEDVPNNESKMMKLLLETTKQILTQNISIIEKQNTLDTTITQLANDIKTLQSSHKDFKSNIKDNNQEW
ncbi:11413_t:CDS:2 [Dentiscutata erythropus]|uniref:11413_t:CDS:1 n=1 Tax=Dentiscutata erythropus TaxID=1348616 RepID=A0A9N9G3V4_9GLOM|nr:11413_t:CDS:2 [Dentiscutata erythropus]